MNGSAGTTLLAPYLPLSQEHTNLPDLENTAKGTTSTPNNRKQKTSLFALRKDMIIRPTKNLYIEEPNDELVTAPSEAQGVFITKEDEKAKHVVALPVARPAPEPMDPEFVSFDGLASPPLQTQDIKLHRRFANALTEIKRIKLMLHKLGITPDMEPEKWNTTLAVSEQYLPALFSSGIAGVSYCI